jgi:hypothetical protein
MEFGRNCDLITAQSGLLADTSARRSHPVRRSSWSAEDGRIGVQGAEFLDY